LESIHHKFLDARVVDESKWPTITTEEDNHVAPSKPSAPTKRAPRDSLSGSESDEDEDEDEDTDGDGPLKKYWESRRIKYAMSNLDVETLSVSRADKLPPNWVVINMSVTDDKSSLLISRQRASNTPLVFCVPLQDRREDGVNEDSEQLTYDGALEEFKEIIRLSHLGTQQAAHVKNNDLQARAAWWADRATLDKRLKELLEEIEFCWLGAFKVCCFFATSLR
jgi:separase